MGVYRRRILTPMRLLFFVGACGLIFIVWSMIAEGFLGSSLEPMSTCTKSMIARRWTLHEEDLSLVGGRYPSVWQTSGAGTVSSEDGDFRLSLSKAQVSSCETNLTFQFTTISFNAEIRPTMGGNLFSETHGKPVLIVPMLGRTFGEMFGATYYPSYVALKVIQRELGLDSIRDIDVVMVGDREVPCKECGKRQMTGGICWEKQEDMPFEERVWPTWSKERFSVNMSQTMQVFKDGSTHNVDFRSIAESCNARNTSFGSTPVDYFSELLTSWGVQHYDARDPSFPLTGDLLIQSMFVLDSTLALDWGKDPASTPRYIEEMLSITKQHYLGYTPTKTSTTRDTITLLARSCTKYLRRNCCRCKRLWLNQEEVLVNFRLRYPTKKVRIVHLEDMSLQDTIGLMDRTEVLVSIHGSGLWNEFFLHHTSAVVEVWPIGYWEQKYQNQARFASVLYVHDHALRGNWKGHDAWTTTPLTQINKLMDLALTMTANMKSN